MGRPPTAPAIFEDAITTVCTALSDGIPMAVVLRSRPDLPPACTIQLWRRNNPDIEARVKQAREDGWDMIAWGCREVAKGGEGSTQDVKRDKLIVETALKLLAKWDPKRYGDKVELSGVLQHQAADLPSMTQQLVTQVTMNPTLAPVLREWAQDLISKLEPMA
jgi:hypothetical protein